jgi:hypothetical protein
MMKEAYVVRYTVPPSAEIQANIDKLLGKGMVDDPQKMLSELARLGARLIIQRAVEEEFDTWLGRARYERRPVVTSVISGCLTGVSRERASSRRFVDPSPRELRCRPDRQAIGLDRCALIRPVCLPELSSPGGGL